MESKDIDKLFQDAFEHAEETPNERVWQGISQELSNDEKVVPFFKRHIKNLSVAAAILVILGIGFSYFNSQNEITPKNQPIAYSSLNENKEEKLVNEVTQNQDDENDHSENLVVQEAKISTVKFATINHKEKSEPIPAKSKENLKKLTIDTDIALANAELVTRQVTEVDDIKPLIQLDEELETMYASSNANSENSTIVTKVLNKISENLEVSEFKDIRFRADEEGSLRIDIFNSLVKNRIKKRN